MKQRSGREIRWRTLDQWHTAGAWVQLTKSSPSFKGKSSFTALQMVCLKRSTKSYTSPFLGLFLFIRNADIILEPVPTFRFALCFFFMNYPRGVLCCHQLFEMVVLLRLFIFSGSVASIVRDSPEVHYELFYYIKTRLWVCSHFAFLV